MFPNSIVCGVVPLFDEKSWKLVCFMLTSNYICAQVNVSMYVMSFSNVYMFICSGMHVLWNDVEG